MSSGKEARRCLYPLRTRREAQSTQCARKSLFGDPQLMRASTVVGSARRVENRGEGFEREVVFKVRGEMSAEPKALG